MPTAKRGRDPKITPEVQKVIVDRVAAGVPLKHAAQAAGIAERTIHLWISKGKAGKKPYDTFHAALKKAESDAIARNVAIIQKAAAKTWTAAAWWLERRHPDEFGSSRREVYELKKELAKAQQANGGTPAGSSSVTKHFTPTERGPNDAEPEPTPEPPTGA